MDSELENNSFIGRLLEEVSWEKATHYRGGGRRRENVLTAEVLLPLHYLPRDLFLGEVLRRAHGADAARELVASEIEDARIRLLPGDQSPAPDVVVQPDAELSTPSGYVLVEAKRMGRSSFQRDQLAKEFIAVKSTAGDRQPLLLLILGTPPPVSVRSRGLLAVDDAIAASLLELGHALASNESAPQGLRDEIRETVAWITWSEIEAVISAQQQLFRVHHEGSGLRATVERLAQSVVDAVRWHA
jgi:hypothetical protein